MDPNATENVLAALLASARQPGPFNTFLQGLGALEPPANPALPTTQATTSPVSGNNPNGHPLATSLATNWNLPIQQTVEAEPVASGSGFRLPGWGYNPPPQNTPTEPVASGSGFRLPGWGYNPPPQNTPTEPVASGSRLGLPGWGYSPPPQNTPNRGRQTVLSARNNLFQPYVSPGPMKKTKNKFVSPVKVLKKIVVGLKSVQMEEYPRKPDSFDLNELSDSGLGEQIIEFFSTDNYGSVLQKIISVFKPYRELKGGLQMFVQAERGNCQLLKRCVQPLLNGSQLQTLAHTKVYVAPLQNESIPIKNAQQASYNVECLECGTTLDAVELEAHHSICKDRLYQEGLQNPEGLGLLLQLSHQQMNATEQEATDDENRRNSVRVKRASLMDDAIELSQNEDFLAKLSLPLMVTFIDEPGVDCGALRSEFLWSLMDEFKETFDAVLSSYQSATASEDSDSGSDEGAMSALSKKNLGQRLFTFGLFCGITIIQIGPLGSFFLSALKRVSGAGQDHPFLRGLNIQKVGDLLAQYQSVRSLFGDKVLTSEDFLKCVSFDPLPEDLPTSMLQLSCQHHFETFIKNVESGTVDFTTKGRKLKLEDVFKFCTGGHQPGRDLESEKKIVVSFQLSPLRSLPRPIARTCFRKLILSMTPSAESMEKLMVESICNGGSFSMA